MTNNILVIGNGFDLAHDLPTKYEDFIEFVRKFLEQNKGIISSEDDQKFMNLIETNGFIQYFLDYTNDVPGWVDLEQLIKKVIHSFEVLFQQENVFINKFSEIVINVDDSDSKNKNRIKRPITFFPMFCSADVGSISEVYRFDERYYTEKNGLIENNIVSLLRKQLDNTISALEMYFLIYVPQLVKDNAIRAIKQIEDIKPSYVISFNYTDTYKIYGIDGNDVFHVHGKLNSDPNNMVLGFDDDDPTKLDFVYFKKYFQRIQKLTGYIDRKQLSDTVVKDDIDSGIFEYNYSIVHFYGHSMDNTDGDIIRELKALSKGFVI